MLYLMPEIANALGEDTFWTWAKREFPNSIMEAPTTLQKGDVLLRYSTNRSPMLYPENTITMLWDMQYELKKVLQSNAWDEVLTVIDRAGQSSAKLTGYSSLMTPYYAHYNKPIDILPVGVNTDLFKPHDKLSVRAKYNLPADRRIGIWSGDTHPMDGFDKLQAFAAQNPDILWVIVWKWAQAQGYMEGARNFPCMPQQDLSELISCADFFLACGRLHPFFLVEWEAMACNTPLLILDGMEKDFVPSANPRDDVFRLGWDRHTAKKTWLNYINKFIEEKHAVADSRRNMPPVQVLRDPARRFLRRPPR